MVTYLQSCLLVTDTPQKLCRCRLLRRSAAVPWWHDGRPAGLEVSPWASPGPRRLPSREEAGPLHPPSWCDVVRGSLLAAEVLLFRKVQRALLGSVDGWPLATLSLEPFGGKPEPVAVPLGA
jgi:hypothetical protein